VLDPDELDAVGAAYGVLEEQVRRDHLISHVLHAVSTLESPPVFFGGTALARTHLTTPELGGRLSEDIDLMTCRRRELASALDERLPVMLRREFPRTRWAVSLSDVRAVDPAQLVTGDGLRLRIQLLDLDTGHADWKRWPVEERTIVTRYADVRARTVLPVPTLDAFTGMKTVAFADRRAARDLYDLAALARIGAVTPHSAELVRSVTGVLPTPHWFEEPLVTDWAVQLAHQTADLPSAQDCLNDVRDAFANALGWPPPYDPLDG
jgi:nucleotidyltransferase AbiEii toxin of type IV toxin-antitoxin system